ncbi:hypothetical protein C1X59_27580 [Pseudomonas sp. FW215-R2]|uniref:hypothetical protein n=1 Tax=unclassified Pseudomonas TaxID=196821 RepID=UPI000C887408|nr:MULTISPECIES: hypothetical protein [unclassified Pseudomonas]PMW94845.1 hypothetical protein C1X59_27580 [Pseudomonas sp. FW215-R2]PMX05480.1 hypothetical protein C1X60_27885 [Pseudomonas sp. FW215-L1]PMX18034.1 hypothetical protein C1X57_27305 [Pseudomonas sp. FW215-E1]PNA31071.1 hypothetical protein C1X58_09360 [Pseudomonas sp. FW215-R4]
MSDSKWMAKENLAEHLAPLLDHFEVKWRGHGVIYVDHQDGNIQIAERILYRLSTTLGVPIGEVRSRLVELGWLNDVRHVTPMINEVVRVFEERDLWSADDPEENDPEMNEDFGRD